MADCEDGICELTPQVGIFQLKTEPDSSSEEAEKPELEASSLWGRCSKEIRKRGRQSRDSKRKVT